MKIPILSDILGHKNEPNPEEMMQMMPSNNINFSGASGADYPESYYRNQTEIRKVTSQDDMNEWVENSLLSRRCKDAFKSLIANVYDDNIILSYHQLEIQSEISYLEATVYLKAPVIANSYRSDRNNPAWNLIMSEVYYQLKHRVTRTVGPDRERIVQGKIQQDYNIKQGMITPQINPQQR